MKLMKGRSDPVYMTGSIRGGHEHLVNRSFAAPTRSHEQDAGDSFLVIASMDHTVRSLVKVYIERCTVPHSLRAVHHHPSDCPGWIVVA
jgi:hypothetical protein